MRLNRSLYILMLFIFCALAASALYYTNLNSNKLLKKSAKSILVLQQKTHAINGLSQSIQNRSNTLLSMLNEKDPFILDSLNQELYSQAFLFRQHRDMLKKLGLNSEQSKTLKQLLKLTDINSKNQLVVAKLLINEEKTAAMTLLFDTAIPNQSPITTLLREFEKLIEADNATALSILKNQIDKTQQIIWALTILLSLLVIVFISQLINVLKS